MSDDPNNSTQQNLAWRTETLTSPPEADHRPWWRNEAGATGAGGIAVRAAVVATETTAPVIDIGQELEEEARLRVATNAVDQLVEIHPKPQVVNERMLKRILYATAFLTLALIVQCITTHDPMPLTMVPVFLIEIAVIGRAMSRLNARRTKPMLVLSREGIEINTVSQHIGLLKWDEIEEIGTFNLGDRTIGIVPKDVHNLCKRIPATEAFCMRANHAFARLFPKSARKYFAPITLTQQMLPITPEEVLRMIEKFRRENNV